MSPQAPAPYPPNNKEALTKGRIALLGHTAPVGRSSRSILKSYPHPGENNEANLYSLEANNYINLHHFLFGISSEGCLRRFL